MNKIKSFFYGIIAASGATILQQIVLLSLNVQIIDTSHLTGLLIFGAFSEEIFKFFVIYKLSQEETLTKNLVLNSLLIGLGFSLVELVFKIWGDLEIVSANFLAYLGIIFIHVLTAGTIGYFLSREKPAHWTIPAGIFLALLLHLAYNALLIYSF